MTQLFFAVLGSLVFLMIVAVYSAVCVGRKTDEIVSAEEDATGSPLVVRFPDAAFNITNLSLHRR